MSDGEPEETETAAEEGSKSLVKAGKGKKRKRGQNLTINLTNCKYDSVRRVARQFGLRPVGDDEEWTVLWTDTSVVLERVMNMKRYQKINHFPGMVEICRKDFLARNMTRMLKLFPKDYNCFPRTWVLPADYGDFQDYCRAKKNKLFIAKPESGSQGKGIFIFRNHKDIRAGEHLVCQQYIAKPFAIDGFKFDYRIYVLVTSCDPLRVYVYKDGLARFATIQYHEPTTGNISDVYMHLTNYAINKHSDNFVRDDDSGSKRRITTINKWFEDNGYDINKIWHDIEDVIIKTLLSIHPILKHNYRSCFPNHNRGSACFEILGFDILLDKKLKPWLIEVNHSPSFHTDAPLDKEVKEGLLHDALNLVDLYANDRRKCMEEDRKRVQERLFGQKSKETSQQEEDTRAKYEAHLETYEKTHKGGLRRIYPNGNEDYYAKFFDQSTSLCAETAASKARSELSRQHRQEIEAKQKEMEGYKKKLGAPPAAAKSEAMRPESPRETSSSSTTIKRRTSFRLPTYQKKKESQTDTEAPVPCGHEATPQAIKDDEELERLAGLQLRDSLVRGLGVSEQLQSLFVTTPTDEQSRAISRMSSHRPDSSASTVPKSMFFTHTVYPDSVMVPSYSHSSLPSTETTLQSTLPGFVFSRSYKRLSAHSHTRSNTNSFSVGNRTGYGPPKRSLHQPLLPQMPSKREITRSQKHLELNSELFGLSVTSAPIRLSSRRHHCPPTIRPSKHYANIRPSGTQMVQNFTMDQKIRNLELLAAQSMAPT